jgi:hypothetical protein
MAASMRNAQWVLVVSAALFVAGIGFIVAAGRTSRLAASEPEVKAVAMTPVANVMQIMNAIVIPNAEVVYGAVGTTITTAGIVETAPKDDQEWAKIGDSASALVESGNLMLMGSRAIDQGDWVTMTRAFMAAGEAALKAANEKKVDDMFAAGGDLAVSCDNCHARYQRR